MTMRRHRTIYFNDARHYYLFVYEPSMRLEDAWVPIDGCAGLCADEEDAFERPKDFDGAISIDDVELVVEYDVFPNSRG